MTIALALSSKDLIGRKVYWAFFALLVANVWLGWPFMTVVATPWSEFAAISILMNIPLVKLFFALQRYIFSGLTVESVKG